MQIFCFTFAGGTTAFYSQVEKCITPEIKIEKLEYAGHGLRYKEAFYNDFLELAEDMYSQIKDKNVGEYALMGYSMGSIAATEVLRLIIDKKQILCPKYIFLAAHEPRSKTDILGKNEADIDEYVKRRTIEFGGVPNSLINNKSFWRMYLPIYRADYSLIENYRFENLELRTTIPAKIFYSEEDTPFIEMQEWSKYYTGQLDFVRYEGTHFFIQNHCKEICTEIETALGYRKTKEVE